MPTPDALRDEVIAHCEAERWDAAADCLRAHDAWLRAEIAAGRLTDAAALQAWLQRQRALAEEIRERLDATAGALGQLGRAGRGVSAYRQSRDG